MTEPRANGRADLEERVRAGVSASALKRIGTRAKITTGMSPTSLKKREGRPRLKPRASEKEQKDSGCVESGPHPKRPAEPEWFEVYE